MLYKIIVDTCFRNSYIRAKTQPEYFIATFVVLVASLTDFLDGFIARKFDMVTELANSYPVVDKLIQFALLFVLLLKTNYVYVLVIIFLIKEVTMAITGFVFFKKGKKLDGAKWFGKVSTTVFYLTMSILILFPKLYDYNKNIVYTLLIICASFLVLSFLLYGREYYIMYKES